MSGQKEALGPYCPLVTPFKAGSEDIDVPALEALVKKVASAGVGVCVLGTNGESSHLTLPERDVVISTARKVLDEDKLNSLPLMAGCGGAGSTREAIQYVKEAAKSGAECVLVISPGYYKFAFGGNKPLKQYLTEVFDASPIPVQIYNFPGAAAGIDLDADTLLELAQHPKCCGVKLTCGSISKGYRLSVNTQTPEYKKKHPLTFAAFPGFSDYVLAATFTGHLGVTTGTANVYPKTIAKLWELCLKAKKEPSPENVAAAEEVQFMVIESDAIIVKNGIGGTKALMNAVTPGSGGVARSPLSNDYDGKALAALPAMAKTLKYEASL